MIGDCLGETRLAKLIGYAKLAQLLSKHLEPKLISTLLGHVLFSLRRLAF